MQVLKFGGSSVANAENISKVSAIVRRAVRKGKIVVVVSALSGVTDLLLRVAALASEGDDSALKQTLHEIEQKHFDVVKHLMPVVHQSHLLSLVKKSVNEIEDICNGVFLLRETTPRTLDRLASYGEWLSSQIICAKIKQDGLDIQWKDSRELVITDSAFTRAQINFDQTNKKITAYFRSNPGKAVILPGFIASDERGVTTTIGRGGSDYTAAIITAAMNAEALQIWTDVSGMMTADPRLVSNAKVIQNISYGEAMELSHFGAKVIYPPTIQPVMTRGIPIWIKNTFDPESHGTSVTKTLQPAALGEDELVRGISSISGISLLSLEGSGMIGTPGISKRLFEALSREKINVILITQSSSEHSICVAINSKDTTRAKTAVDKAFADEIILGRINPLAVEQQQCVVALVGENMKSRPGVSGRMFGALGRNGINVRAIAQGSSEKNISAVIAAGDVKKAINVLHEEFFETTYKQINLFIMGVGNVGSKLIAQLQHQAAWLRKHLRVVVHIAGLANSRKMIFSSTGIPLQNWQQALDEGAIASVGKFFKEAVAMNLRNSIFVDVTASKSVADMYEKFLGKSISVVACNKIAASSRYERYRMLKELARHHNCKFLFETNVGAALPVIGTLNDLLQSGDEIFKIEAVLSGTLNFVFNHYDGSRSFAEVVKQAQDEGYAEPDPRLDLGGTDVMRKILILAREAGYEMEMKDISNRSFMPKECMKGTVAEFYDCLAKHESHFKKMLADAVAKNCKLKFVALFNRGKASVGLQHIKPQDNLYHLYGKDNIVLFYTGRYADQPLVVKGAGAGADITASGVFADIVRATAP